MTPEYAVVAEDWIRDEPPAIWLFDDYTDAAEYRDSLNTSRGSVSVFKLTKVGDTNE
ncbi:MAG: hypothetical protein WCP28_01945 [Actinomycetes bacterium]